MLNYQLNLSNTNKRFSVLFGFPDRAGKNNQLLIIGAAVRDRVISELVYKSTVWVEILWRMSALRDRHMNEENLDVSMVLQVCCCIL